MSDPHDGSIVWLVWMARWGEPSPTHAYIEAVYATGPEDARAHGEEEAQYRGGKYQFQHCPCRVNLKNPVNPLLPTPEAPEEVYVSTVRIASRQISVERVHLVGAFTSEEDALEHAELMYPASAGWEVAVQPLPVIKTPRG